MVKYGTREDVKRLIESTKGDDAGLRTAAKKKPKKKSSKSKKK